MQRPEPSNPDNRKLAFYANMGALAAEKRTGLKSLDAWQTMFPAMFDGVNTNTPAVNETSAQKIATVFTCLNVRGETLGSLPFSVKKNTDNGPETVYGDIHRLLHDRPNAYTTAFDFWSTIEKLKLAWGNSYAEIIRTKTVPTALIVLLPWEVEIKQIKETGEIYYMHKGRVISATNVLHFKNYSTDGICGLSSIRQNALTLGIALKLNQYNSSIIGERPFGYLTSETKPKDLQQKDNIRSQWDKRNTRADETDTASGNKQQYLNGIPYLYGGLKFESFTLPADDVAYIESAKLKDQDIYGIFRIPPTFAQNWERAPYNSSEQQDIVFAKYTLASIKEIEQECTEKLFTEANKSTGEFYCKFSLNGLLRGDMKTRKEFYSGLFNIGALTPNQICELEDQPTYGPAGDQHFVQGALVPVDLVADMIKAGMQPKEAPKADTTEEDSARMREEIMSELRLKMQSRLNGHYKDVAELLN